LPDPAVLGNTGSFFRNPVIDAEKSNEINQLYPQAPLFPTSHGKCKISAAWLIQQSGWRNKRDRNVGTFKWQPLVIVNYGGASGKEILAFAQKIIDSVEDKFGVKLEPEVNVV
jgi:UDP-N-acetylmuramate dehydrogenase